MRVLYQSYQIFFQQFSIGSLEEFLHNLLQEMLGNFKTTISSNFLSYHIYFSPKLSQNFLHLFFNNSSTAFSSCYSRRFSKDFYRISSEEIHKETHSKKPCKNPITCSCEFLQEFIHVSSQKYRILRDYSNKPIFFFQTFFQHFVLLSQPINQEIFLNCFRDPCPLRVSLKLT